MHQGSDYPSQHYYPYHQIPPLPNANANPNPIEFPSNPLPTPAFASAPPYQPPPMYPSYLHNADAAAAPYAAPQPQTTPQSPPFQPYAGAEQAPAGVNTYLHLQQQQPDPYYGYEHHQQHPAAPAPSPYENPYENAPGRYDQSGGSGGYYDGNAGQYGSSPPAAYGSGLAQGLYEKRPDGGVRYEPAAAHDDMFTEGVYAYDGGRMEPYGARGTVPSRNSSSSSWSGFDDYGRATGLSSSQKEQGGEFGKIVRAVPKAESQQDVKSGVQKFRVKLLAEGSGQSTQDVLCQVGLDGIRMLDPNTNRTLRIYPLDTVTRTQVVDPSVFAFWAKTSVDIEPRRIRLQSNTYTTSTILDTVTAASVQYKEMGGNDGIGSSGVPDSWRPTEQGQEKKKGLIDLMNLIKPANEEKDHWVPDEVVSKCTACGTDFGAFVRKHHCRNCGDIFCDKCTSGRIALTLEEQAQPVRVCDRCMAEVTQRLSHAKESVNKHATLHSHEDLAKKIQEEMEKNRKASSGLKSSEGSGRQMREVACPTCTVHLQVQVPSSGSATIECGVCQNPFLVSAH